MGIIIRSSERYDQVKNRNDPNRKLITNLHDYSSIEWREVKIRGLLVTKFLILDSAPFNRGACVQASRIPTQFVSRTSPLGTLPTNLVEARLSESTLRIIQSKFSSNHCVTSCCEGLVSTMQFSLDHKRRFKMRRKWTRPDSCDFDSVERLWLRLRFPFFSGAKS